MQLRQCIDEYLADVRETLAPSTLREHTRYARRLAEVYGDLSVAELDTPRVFRLHRRLRDTPVAANRFKSFVSQVCDFAERIGERPTQSNPTRAIANFPEHPRTEFLDDAERARFVEACCTCVAEGSVKLQAAFLCLLMLLTGMRLHEATNLRWRELDLKNGVIRFMHRRDRGAGNKGSRDEAALPITDDVVELLRTFPRRSEYVAPNPRTGRPYVDLRKPMTRLCDRAELGRAVRRHALRHTFGTSLAEIEMTAEEIKVWMRHRSPVSATRYLHLVPKGVRRHSARVSAATRGVRHAA